MPADGNSFGINLKISTPLLLFNILFSDWIEEWITSTGDPWIVPIYRKREVVPFEKSY